MRLFCSWVCTCRRPHRICERNNLVRRFGNGRAGFWMKHLCMSCLCFCWMPTVTSSKLHGQSRSVSTAAKKLHSMVSVWENSCEIITWGRRTLTFLWERLSLDPSPTPRSTLRVFLLLFILHHDGDRLQLAAVLVRRDHRPIQCVFQHQLTYGIHERRQEHPFSRRTGPRFCHEWRKHAGTMKSGTIWRLPIFGRNSIKCSWQLALTCTPEKFRPRSQLLRIHWMRDTTWQRRNLMLWNYLLVVPKIRCVTQTFLRTLSGWDTYSQDGGPTRQTGGRQQQYVDFRDVTRRKNTPSKHSASPTRGTNVTSGRYGQRLEPCFPTLVDRNEDDMTFLWVLCRQPLHGRHISDKLDLWRGMGSTATGSEIPRTTGGTLGRSRRILRGNRGTWEGFSWYGAASSTIPSAACDSELGSSRRTFATGGGSDAWQHSEETRSRLQSPMACPLFQSRLWQGIGLVRRAGCVSMWWHRSSTFPIDKSNNKDGCNAVRLVSYLWRRQPQT